MRIAVGLASLGAALIATGVAFVFWPAGLAVAGVELVIAGYVAAYVVNVRKGRA